MRKRVDIGELRERKAVKDERRRRRERLLLLRFQRRTLEEQQLAAAGVEHARRTPRGTLLYLLPAQNQDEPPHSISS